MGIKKTSLLLGIFILIILSLFLYYNNEVIKLRKLIPEKKEIIKSYKLQQGRDPYWNTIYDNLENKDFLLSDDYFIVGTSDYGPRAQLYALNLNTRRELLLYNELTNRTYINQIIRFDNTLFFTTGGYMAPSSIYYINFPFENNSINKIEGEYANAEIKQINGNYWISSGEGDSCMSGGKYDLFDIKNKKSIFKINYSNDCGNGNELIILNDKVINGHFINETNDELGTSTYTQINKVDLSYPFKKSELINKDKMPKDIYDIKYDKEINSLLLYGKEKYIFNLDNLTLVKKDFNDLVNTNKGYIKWNEKKIQELKSMKLPEGYRIIESNIN